MTPYYPDFPKSEYDKRYAQARELMAADSLDALLITERLNYIYFTGHRSQQNVIDKVRPYVFVLPKDRDGVMITVPFEMDQVRATTWVESVRTVNIMERQSAIVAALEDLGLSKARLGAELGLHQYLGISYNEFQAITRSLPSATFVDASDLFVQLRAVKSPLEIQYLRTAAQITADAIQDTFRAVDRSMRELDVMRILRTALAQRGAENVTFMWIVNSLEGMVGIPTDRRLRPGGFLAIDMGVEYHGYCSDIARTASIGEPRDETQEFYRWMLTLRKECVGRLRAGESPASVLAVCEAGIRDRGLTTLQPGRIGHGVGLESTEYPSLGRGEGQVFPGEQDIRFRPGMVLACNPSFTLPEGWINIEDEWLITETEPEMLTSAPPDNIPVLDA